MAEQKRREKSRLVVYRVFGQTLATSARVLYNGVRGRLSTQRVERIIDDWSRRLYTVGEATLEYEGLHHLVPGQPYVVMSNHASLVDVPSICRSFPGPVRMVSKSELARIPLFGSAMRQIGTVIVDRQDTKKAIQQLEDARAIIAQGVSLWIAPEGTRSKDGRLGPFKKGGFHVALEHQLPIVPVWIEGSRDILETKKLVAQTGGHVHVIYGAPISTVGATREHLSTLMAKVRHEMLLLARRAGSVAAVELDFVDDDAGSTG